MIDGDFNAHLIGYVEIGKIAQGSNVRETNKIHGTPPFMAPESFCYMLTLKSDIFSIGATMFQMITNEFPFSDLYSTEEGVERIRQIIENNLNSSEQLEEMEENLDELNELYKQLHETDEERDYEKAGDIFSSICSIIPNIIRNLVCKGIVDDRYKEGTDNFNKLSEVNKEIMKLAYRCMDPDQDLRPTCDQIIEELINISHNKLPSETYNEIEEYIGSLDDIAIQKYGTKEFIEKGVSKHFDAIDGKFKEVAKGCLPDYTEPSETDKEG